MRYWEERAKEWAKARDKKEHKINAALVDSYKNAADDLQKEIAAWYEKYADAEGISFADAKKRLDERERRALTRSVKAFEKLAKQNKDHSQDKILTKMSAAVHINRLTSMQFQMRYILYELYSDVNNELADGLKEFYADEREQMAYEAQMARGKFEPIATIDEKRISAVLKTPWATDGKDFSARLWNNREQLVSTLQSELTRALITGADSASVAKTIAQKMNAAQYAASRLVSTEITRIITASDIDTFAEMDIDEVEVVGTLDLHTCDTCGDMDSKHMPRTEAKEGMTAPPFHPNCRCAIVPYFGDGEDTRAMRDPVTGKSKIIENMTFKEWKEKYGSGSDTAKMMKNLLPPTDEFIKSLAEKAKVPYTTGRKGEDRFYDDNDNPIYPLNNGAVGEEEQVVLPKGLIISRYGADTGKFASPQVTSMKERSLPKETRNAGKLHMYEVASDVVCFTSVIAAWFGQKGGGIQYRFEDRILDLIEDGVLIEKDM